MTEKELKAFINVVTNYFFSVTNITARMGLPTVKKADSKMMDFTGAIGISGSRRGAIYFTAGRELLEDFSAYILGNGTDIDSNVLFDLVGEMTNTIAGNVRKTFGSEFMISVPIILKGELTDIEMKLGEPVFVIPIEWKAHRCYLAIGLE